MTATARAADRPVACVIGEIDLVRALGLGGIRSVVCSPPGDFTRYSRFTEAAIDPGGPSARAEDLVERLLEFARAQPAKPVLFYDGDWDLLMVSRFREALGEGFRFVVPDAELVEDLADKSRFESLAARMALPVPATARLAPGRSAAEAGLRFPVVVKPLTREHSTWKPFAAAKVIQVEDGAALEHLWSRLSRAGIDAVAQELVPGSESRIESYHAYVDGDGRVAAEFTGRKIRTFPPAHGYSTALVVTQADDVARLGRDILERLRFRGVAKLDFKRHPADGQLHLLEINPRFNLWHHVGARAGVNLPATVYRDLVGLPRQRPGPATPGVSWVNPWRDAAAARLAGLPLRRWLPWAIRCEAKCAFAWDDPLPLIGAALHRARRRVRRRH